MSEQDNVEVVQTVYRKFGEGDISGIMDFIAEDVVVELYGPAVIPFAGTFNGRDGIAKFFQLVGENLEVEMFEPLEFIVQGDTVVALGHERVKARSTGKGWETQWAMIWTVDAGKVVCLREYHNTADMVAAFG
jgi:ketosteroid isomerase-like protein